MKHKKGLDVNGWLIVDKPTGVGSTTIVNQTRHLFDAKKNGHTGTLDPFASGVLPIAFGEATKLVPYVTDGRKEYEFTLQFGTATDTADLTGQVIQESEKRPTKDEILAALPSFLGEITQIPPVYSAIKINGERAYDLARRGIDVQIPERRVTIYGLELLKMPDDSSARFRVECSKGTYVRTLGVDLAEKLGCCGHLTVLRRTKCGHFSLKDTILLENLKKIEYVNERQKFLLPLLTCLCDITVIAVREEDAAKLRQGQSISPKNYKVEHLVGKETAAVVDNKPVAMVRIEKTKILPIRVFNL